MGGALVLWYRLAGLDVSAQPLHRVLRGARDGTADRHHAWRRVQLEPKRKRLERVLRNEGDIDQVSP